MKTIIELKKAIQNKNLSDSLLVLQSKDALFVALQYAHEIAKFKDLQISLKEDFDLEFLDSKYNMFDFSDIDILKIFIVDEFKTSLKEDLLTLKNVIVICKTVNSKVLSFLKDNEMYFEIPKLQEWHIEAYMSVLCPGLQKSKIKWLCKQTNYNVYRLFNESKKINCFNKNIQDEIFDLIDSDDGYNDLTQTKIFDLSNAINARDYKETVRILKEIKHLDIDSYALVSILKNSFLLIAEIQMDPTATASSLNIKQVQYNIIKFKNCKKYTDEKLRKIINFLTDFDYRLKSGELDINKNRLIDLIICEIMS